MKLKFNLLVLAALSLSFTACKYNAAKILARPNANYILEVESGACYGTCPIYTFKLNENRKLDFKGGRHCAFEGDTSIAISAEDYQKLKETLINKGFFGMDSVYDYEEMMDVPNYIISVSDPKDKFKTQRVRGRVEYPDEFGDLKTDITDLLVKYGMLGG
tara:strand:+ start:1179 stop:1658 length:480 start_codon:yes stop_codon:yes gene_type:complete